jgi:hypothetical protein
MKTTAVTITDFLLLKLNDLIIHYLLPRESEPVVTDYWFI